MKNNYEIDVETGSSGLTKNEATEMVYKKIEKGYEILKEVVLKSYIKYESEKIDQKRDYLTKESAKNEDLSKSIKLDLEQKNLDKEQKNLEQSITKKDYYINSQLNNMTDDDICILNISIDMWINDLNNDITKIMLDKRLSSKTFEKRILDLGVTKVALEEFKEYIYLHYPEVFAYERQYVYNDNGNPRNREDYIDDNLFADYQYGDEDNDEEIDY